MIPRRQSLFFRLNRIIILVNLACYMLVGVVVYNHLNTQATTQTRAFVSDACRQAAGSVGAFTHRYEWNADLLSSDTAINDFLNTQRDSAYLSYPVFLQYKSIHSRLSQLISTDPAMLSVTVMKDDPHLLSDGVYICRTDGMFLRYMAENPRSLNRWACLDGWLYLLNTPRASRESLLVMRLDEQALYQSVGVEGKGVDYYLTDDRGVVLSSSDRSLPGSLLPRPLQNALEAGQICEIEGNVMCDSTETGSLRLLVTYPVSDMRQANTRTVLRIILTVLLAMCFSIVLLSLLSRTFSGNIRRILQKLRVMGGGDFLQEADVRTGDELEQIDKSVCDLGSNVDRLNKNLIDAAEHEKAMELRFLQMQINRHFLNNSLSSLRWMAVRKGEGELSELMENLMDFYRVTLSQDDILLLRDEIALVENYVRLENVIHMGEIHFHCDIPAELRDIRVCKMTLQPFIENSIHHGKIQGTVLDIWLTGEEISDNVLLRVEDNGLGMSPERMEELEEILQGKKSGGDSIAICNTLSRLRGLYGPDADIAIMAHQGTVIEIMLPLGEKQPRSDRSGEKEETDEAEF